MKIPILVYIGILVVLICLSALFSATETAFSSANLIRIKQFGAKGDKRAIKAYYLLKEFTAVITAILICNNVVNILATSIATFLLAQYFNELGVLMATVLMTIIIVLFGEIAPKLIAKDNAEKIVINLTPLIILIIKVLSPIIKVAVNVQDHLSDDEVDVTATEEELLQIVHTIEKEGVLDQDERELIESAITFDDKMVRDVMRARSSVTFIFDDAQADEILSMIKTHKYSRIPVVNHENLQVIGIIRERDILECLLDNQKILMVKLIRPVISVSQRSKLPDVLEKLQKSREHMAIVVENKRNLNFVGVVTLEDILEEIVGEIYDEYDDLPKYVIEIGHHTYEIEGSAPIHQFFDEYLDQEPPKTKARNFAGWIHELSLGKRVTVGRRYKYENFILRVLSIDDGRISKIELEVLSKNRKDFNGG